MMEPLEQVTVMITLVRQLETVMQREIRALRTMAMDEVEALQNEKALLTDAYEVEMGKLRRDPHILGSLDDHARATLDEAIRDLQATARRNRDALAAAKTVVERIVKKLDETVARGNRVGGYGRSAPNYAAAGGGQVIAVAFNHAV